MKRLSLRRATPNSRLSVIVNIDNNQVVYRGLKASCIAWLRFYGYQHDSNFGLWIQS